MTNIKYGTKKAEGIIDDLNRTGADRDIYEAYGRPSNAKVAAFNAIRERAINTPGYNYDLHITGAGSCFFSTIYSYTDEAGNKTIVKDTPSNTFSVTIPALTAIEGKQDQEADSLTA